jgi:hypothetical protein
MQPQQAPVPPRKRNLGWLKATGVGLGTFVVGTAIGAAGGEAPPTAEVAPAPTVTITQPAEAAKPVPTVTVTKPAAPLPKATPKVAPKPKAQPAPTPTLTTAPKPKATQPELTASQEQAIGSAESYLEFTSFSRRGLIQQLSSDAGEGFSVADATYAVDHITVSWKEQAAIAAKAYLAMTNFSRRGLIQQLESRAGDGFTHAEAVYGVTKAGL